MDFAVFISTFGIIFLAELGDKTQLTAMALAARYPWKKVFIGIAAAFALLNLGAVLVGNLLFGVFPIFWVKLVSAALFLYFGIAALLARHDETEEESSRVLVRGPLLTSFMMILLAELGDKTQLVTISLAAQHDRTFTVFAASTLALWSVSLLGIFVGRQLPRHVPFAVIHRAAGCLFLLFGGAILYQAFA